jgi:hypothetical protein
MQGRDVGSGRVNSDMRARGAQPRQKNPGPPRLTGVGLHASDLSAENTSAKKAEVRRDRTDLIDDPGRQRLKLIMK